MRMLSTCVWVSSPKPPGARRHAAADGRGCGHVDQPAQGVQGGAHEDGGRNQLRAHPGTGCKAFVQLWRVILPLSRFEAPRSLRHHSLGACFRCAWLGMIAGPTTRPARRTGPCKVRYTVQRRRVVSAFLACG
eukprot:scaffold3920_cov262-Pinguiococcus_pyrenoidosus.AAC.6